MLHHHRFRDILVTVLGNFGVLFVRALPAKYDSARTQLEVELQKILAFGQVHANKNRLWQVFHSQILLRQLGYIKLTDAIQRVQNIPLLKPMKEATHLNLAAIQLE